MKYENINIANSLNSQLLRLRHFRTKILAPKYNIADIGLLGNYDRYEIRGDHIPMFVKFLDELISDVENQLIKLGVEL